MNGILKVLGILSIFLLICTLICGLWVRFGPGGDDMNFHFILSISSVVISLITIILFMFNGK